MLANNNGVILRTLALCSNTDVARTPMLALPIDCEETYSQSWATVAFLRTSGLSMSSRSHNWKPFCLTVVPALAVSIRMSVSKPLAVAIWTSVAGIVSPLAVFM